MEEHQGFRFPIFGPGAANKSATARHRNMLKAVDINPIVAEGNGSHKQPFLNNM